jgi:diaminopimelate epimerase
MKLFFSKFHGAGNDFIMIDNRTKTCNLTSEQIAFLCHRRYGIGADGLILLETPATEGAHFTMKYYNSDGGEGTMCGNGGRSIVAFAHTKGICSPSYVFDAIDGLHHAQIVSNEESHSFDIRLQMQDVSTIEPVEEDLFLNTGSPHLVVFVDNAKNADAVGMGRMLRHDPRFAPGGTNVNFISFAKGRVFVRTYERGVEDETLSCGTGITASAIAITEKLDLPLNSIDLDALGGSFTVTFDKTTEGYRNIWLQGPVKFVFEGTVEL